MNYSTEVIEIREEDHEGKKYILSCKFGCLNEVVPYFSKKEVRYSFIPMTIYEYNNHSYKKDFFCSKCHRRVKISVGSSKASLSRYKLIIGFFLLLFLLDVATNFDKLDSMTEPLTETAVILFIVMIFALLIALIDSFALNSSLRTYKVSLKTEGKRDIEKYHIVVNINRFKE